MDSKYHQWRLVSSVGWGTLLSAYGSSAVTSVLPLIAHHFGSPTVKAKGVVTLYLFALCALLPAAGWLGDRIGNRRLYVYGVLGSFTGASLCALAPSLGWLAGARIIEGAGTASILSAGAALITQHGAFRRRGILLSWMSTMAYIGLAVTPAFAGWLAGAFGWRAIFMAHLPIAAWAFIAAIRNIPPDSPSPLTRYPRTIPRPAMRAVLAAMLTYTALYSLIFMLPGTLLDTRALHPATAGLILSVRPVLTALAAPLGGLLADRYGTRKPQLAGLLLLIVAFIALARWGLQSSLLPLIGTTAIIGVGMGIFLPSNHHLIMSSANRQHRGAASATIALGRNLGMLMGTALCSWWYSSPNIVLIVSAVLVFAAFVCAKHRNTLSSRKYLLTN